MKIEYRKRKDGLYDLYIGGVWQATGSKDQLKTTAKRLMEGV